MSTLKLTLKKIPFDVMVEGRKKLEFRKPSKWIESRLYDKKGNPRHYDFVEFRNGYGADRPYFIAEYNGFDTALGEVIMVYPPDLRVKVEQGDYTIKIGDILEKGNLEKMK